jgi:hypothetical protein
MFTRCDSELWVHFFGISLIIFYLFVATGGLNFEPMLGKYLISLIINIIIIFVIGESPVVPAFCKELE